MHEVYSKTGGAYWTVDCFTSYYGTREEVFSVAAPSLMIADFYVANLVVCLNWNSRNMKRCNWRGRETAVMPSCHYTALAFDKLYTHPQDAPIDPSNQALCTLKGRAASKARANTGRGCRRDESRARASSTRPWREWSAAAALDSTLTALL